ncbi:histone-lysine N-methyltransferase, H3 lysine-9 specific SUVH4-like [Papaver somniferum]|uniref:histone-lysine N-methyltransferase, H3 lysine-9 specific SUVH4-like n=1 Tax=Papaver somniferum TaxID=3469 RepID=UPI000E6FBC6D|nr:histone-lysine N-methyltransferase, H3 lysine-9 specific SUVH4-like [Papaver somniferum]
MAGKVIMNEQNSSSSLSTLPASETGSIEYIPVKNTRNLRAIIVLVTEGLESAISFCHGEKWQQLDFTVTALKKWTMLPHEEYADYTFPIATSIVVLSTLFEEELYYTSQSSQEFEDRILALKNRFLFNHPFGDLNAIEGLCCDDITSADPEKIPIIATNNGGDCPFEPTNFTYSKSLVFAKNVKRPKTTLGCKCQGDCSDPKTCPCAQPNGKYPYRSVQDGRLRNSTKRIIYERGEHCGCGSSCRNKVTQCGLKYKLEVFHTPHKAWGVRTRDLIPKGSYLGEYVGVIRRDEDADEELENVYLFDILRQRKTRQQRYYYWPIPDNPIFTITKAKYCIDGEKVGNYVRFINHSCKPNLFVQSVLSDHRDVSLARIVLFADTNRDILPMEELTYDYNYKIDSVEVNGVIKKMKCRCAAKTCRGRLM